MTAITIGCRVTDTINGFTGLTTGRLEYLNGCRQFLVKPEALDKDGKLVDGVWMDEQNLILDKSAIMPDPFAASKAPKRGGPDRSERSLPR